MIQNYSGKLPVRDSERQHQHLAATARPRGGYEERNSGHGRITTREGQGFAMSSLSLPARWANSGVQTLVVIDRESRAAVYEVFPFPGI
jgi:hypothetical protein